MGIASEKTFRFGVDDSMFRTSSWPGGVIARSVMVAKTSDGVAVRDSKDVAKNTLFFTHYEWNAFLKGVKADEFN